MTKHSKYFLVTTPESTKYIIVKSERIFSVDEAKDYLKKTYPTANTIKNLRGKAVKALELTKQK